MPQFLAAIRGQGRDPDRDGWWRPRSLPNHDPGLLQLGKDIHYFGTAGAGQHAKMANQIMVAGTMTGLVETLVYAKAAGLNLQDVVATVGGGAAANWSLTNYAPGS